MSEEQSARDSRGSAPRGGGAGRGRRPHSGAQPSSGGRRHKKSGDQKSQRPDTPSRRPRRTQRPTIIDPARNAALELLAAVRERDAYANLALPAILRDRGLAGRDAALATELSYGTSRMCGQLDEIIAAGTDRSLSQIDGPILDALRLGAYQLLYTRIPPHAAVSATIDALRAGPGARGAGFANAILRRVSERPLDQWLDRLAPPEHTDRIARLALETAHPQWIAGAISDALAAPAELAAALAANNTPPQVHLIARPGLISQADLMAETGGKAGSYSPYAVYLGGGDPGKFASVREKKAAVQDEGSQLVAAALAAYALEGSDQHWLDLAAGPGGKAGLLGALAAQRGARLTAVEKSPHRANLVRDTVQGLPAQVHTADGRDPDLPHDHFDRVLLDAPCSGLGALRRRPEARWRRRPGDIGPLTILQRELLSSAALLVRPGGVIAYITCSPHLAETAGIIARRPQNLELVDVRPYLPGLPQLGAGPTAQLWPHRHGTDAMFIALLQRNS